MMRESISGFYNSNENYVVPFTSRDDDMMHREMMKPAWLQGLMAETTFFGGCGMHENRRKNEKNVFCLHCCITICPHCIPSHTSHPLLQVRRYVYHDVVRLSDLEKLMDCSYIQPYTINRSKVVFLKHRPQNKTAICKANNVCFTCDRILQHPFNFCSLSCKVDYLVYQGEDMSSIIYEFDESDFSVSQFDGSMRMDSCDDGEITHSSVLENSLQYIGGRGGGGGKGGGSSSCSNETMGLGISQGSDKKSVKKNNGFLPNIALSLGNRRKRAPHRSPLS